MGVRGVVSRSESDGTARSGRWLSSDYLWFLQWYYQCSRKIYLNTKPSVVHGTLRLTFSMSDDLTFHLTGINLTRTSQWVRIFDCLEKSRVVIDHLVDDFLKKYCTW